MNATRLGIALTAAVVAVSALSGCSAVTDIREQATDKLQEVVETGITTASGDLFTAEGIDKAYSAIAAEVGADPMQVVEVTIVTGVLTVEAIDPNAPTELNQWTYTAGSVGAARPVDYDDDVEALQQNLFVSDEIPADVIASAASGAITASGIADGEVQSLIIKRNLPFDDSLTMLINVEGERSSKQVRTDAAGQVTDVV